jgi:DNA topoisomerase-3
MRSVFIKSTGKLYAELYPENEISRDNFEEVLGAMARAELLTFADAVFEKQGKQIPYRTVTLTPAGRAVDESVPVRFVMKDAARPSRKRNSTKSKASSRARARTQSGQARTGAALPEPQIRIEQTLRAWRLSEAKHRKIPAFRVFGDRALRGIAATCPRSDAELLAVPGIGISIVKKYGTQIYRLIAGSS